MCNNKDKIIQKTHLVINQMLRSFDKRECPKFKEMAFMIKRTISFVESIDKMLLDRLDVLTILDDVICSELKNNPQVFEYIFLTTNDKRKQKIIQSIKNCGFVALENSSEEENRFIDNISLMSYKKAKYRLLSGTFKG